MRLPKKKADIRCRHIRRPIPIREPKPTEHASWDKFQDLDGVPVVDVRI